MPVNTSLVILWSVHQLGLLCDRYFKNARRVNIVELYEYAQLVLMIRVLLQCRTIKRPFIILINSTLVVPESILEHFARSKSGVADGIIVLYPPKLFCWKHDQGTRSRRLVALGRWLNCSSNAVGNPSKCHSGQCQTHPSPISMYCCCISCTFSRQLEPS